MLRYPCKCLRHDRLLGNRAFSELHHANRHTNLLLPFHHDEIDYIRKWQIFCITMTGICGYSNSKRIFDTSDCDNKCKNTFSDKQMLNSRTILETSKALILASTQQLIVIATKRQKNPFLTTAH